MLSVRPLAVRVKTDARTLISRTTFPVRRAFATTKTWRAASKSDSSTDDPADSIDIVDTSSFYDAFFIGNDEQLAGQDGAARDRALGMPQGRRMNVMLGGKGRIARTESVALPDENYTPDQGVNIPYASFSEAIFNRLSLPDDRVLAYHWEPMAVRCKWRQEYHRGNKSRTLPSYPGLAIPHSESMRSFNTITVGRASDSTGIALLEKEIERFNQVASVTFFEASSRETLADVFCRFVSRMLDSRYCVEVYGTSETGLMLPFSDVNIRIRRREKAHSTESFSTQELREAQEVIASIAEALTAMPNIQDINIHRSPAPEVEFVHSIVQLKFRITAYKTALRQERYLKALRRKYTHFNALYRLLRSTLHLRRLCNPRTGGISSYILRSMLAAWYSRGHIPDTAAEQLLAFLAFWSRFDTTKYGLSVNTGLFLKHTDQTACRKYAQIASRRGDGIRAAQWELCSRRTPYPWMLCLQNPSFISDDLGRHAYAFKHVLRTFEYLHIKLAKGIATIDNQDELEGDLLHSFVGSFGRSLAASKAIRREGFVEAFDSAAG